MHGYHQHVIFVVEVQQPGSDQRPFCEVEGLLRFLGCEPPGFRLSLSPTRAADSYERERERRGGVDYLYWLIVHDSEGRAQSFVAANYLVKAPLKHRHVERAFQAHGPCDIVKRAAGIQAVKEPQPLLRE
jgi:hypothetical protein